jgi:hypothetical protein
VGVPGQLHIGGIGLARGYWRDEKRTAASFIQHPRTAERLYRTGDLGRYRPDGVIEFLGRLDYQVKVRGFRIELGEIEAALGQHRAVREVVVVAREDLPGDRRMVAYIVAGRDDAPTAAELRAFVGQKLPHYMVPAHVILLDALPLTGNGKVDRQALPAPDHTVAVLDGPFVAPRSPQEEVLAGIWAAVLGLPRVGVTDDFFILGGHSLLATQVISRVRDAFAVELPLRCLFERPTVAELATALQQRLDGACGGPHTATTIARREVEEAPAGLEHLSEEQIDVLLGAMCTTEEIPT